jgi:DNA-binding transcriptional LysR family regulator
MVNETTVKAFLTLVRVGSFTQAAKQLFLSQQAVSKQIAKLEEDLNCTLLRRERGKLELTAEGSIYYKAFAQMDEILTGARREAQQLSAGQDGVLTIAQPELLDLQQVGRSVLRRFQAEHPEVQMIYKSAPSWQVANWLEKGEVDVAFTFAPEIREREELDYILVEQLKEMLVVSADHPKATPDANYLDFRGERVFYTPSTEGESSQLHRRLESMGFPTDNLVPTENLLSSCAAVEQMQGVNFLLEHCSVLNSRTFRTYPDCHVVALVLAYRKDNKKPGVRRLVEMAQQSLKREEH